MKTTVIGSAILASVFSIIIIFIYSPKLSKNVLALGPASSIESEITIPIYQPVDLGSLSSKEIINLRSGIVSKNQQLLAREYTPTGVVFSNIEDRMPWLSVKGFFYHGYSPDSVKGLSNEARNILNPFLLVSAEFLTFSAWTADGLKWDTGRITEKDLTSPEFPLYCRPQKLTWNPRQLKAEVTYPVSSHRESLQKWLQQPVNSDTISLALVDYNARDFGFTHLAVDPRASTGLSSTDLGSTPIELTSHISAIKNACAQGLACNSLTGHNRLLSSLVVNKLPARIVIKLWRGAPKTADDPVNMRFDIVLQ